MLKRPSHRRRSKGTEEIELPLIPVMDAFVTLIAFLLLATSLLAVTIIDTPVPVVSTLPDDQKPERPLMLQLRIEQDGLTLSSAFRRIPEQKFPKVDVGYDVDRLHEALTAIRSQFPTEKNIVFLPSSEVKYDDIVQIMDATRLLRKTDPSFYAKGPDGVDRPDEYLFPNVVFGNVISGN